VTAPAFAAIAILYTNQLSCLYTRVQHQRMTAVLVVCAAKVVLATATTAHIIGNTTGDATTAPARYSYH
jgi:hypothetical protein